MCVWYQREVKVHFSLFEYLIAPVPFTDKTTLPQIYQSGTLITNQVNLKEEVYFWILLFYSTGLFILVSIPQF